MNRSLSQFLAAEVRPEGTMIYPELCGFLFAVACSPEAIPEAEWFPLIFNNEAPRYADDSEAAQVRSSVGDLYKEICREIEHDVPHLPAGCDILEPPMDNFQEEAPLAHWARGFIDGHEWLSEIWEACVAGEADDELGSALMVLFFFADRELAEKLCHDLMTDEVGIEQLAEMVVDNFPAAMARYAAIGQLIAAELDNR